jgi:hypothetical protein
VKGDAGGDHDQAGDEAEGDIGVAHSNTPAAMQMSQMPSKPQL